MKKTFAIILCLLLTSAETISAQVLQLRYDRPASFFEEALVIGNGTMGGIVYGGTDTDRISLNDITFWTGEPVKEEGVNKSAALGEIRAALNNEDYALADKLQRKLQGNFTQNYQPLGELDIRYADTAAVSSYRRWLDISDATAHTSFVRGGYQYDVTYFATNPDSGLVIRIVTDNPKGADVGLTLKAQVPNEVRTTADGIVMDGYAAYFSLPSYYKGATEKHSYDAQRGVHFRTIVRKVVRGRETVIYVTSATSFNGFDKDPVREGRDYKTLADNQMARLAGKAYETLLASHVSDYQRLFNRVSLQLGGAPYNTTGGKTTDAQLLEYLDEGVFNPQLETLYFQYGRYLLISCSRTEAVPANLQGLWNESVLPPWSSNYTSNINVEENYWPAEVANLPEMHNSLLTFIKNLQKTGERNAKTYYGIDRGWCLAQNTDIWALTNPVGMNTGDPKWANWNMGGAWISTHIWEHYTFTLDRGFLEEYYPVLKGAAEFCLNWMVERDGRLITSPSTSPENMYITPGGYRGETCYGGTADVAMIRECLTDTRNAAKELRRDDAFVRRVDDALSRLEPYKIGKNGNIQEWYYDWADAEPSHRHQSHLIGIYPGHCFYDGVNTVEALRKAAARTLEIRGDKSTGWSTGWRVSIYARLGDARNAYHMYRKLLSYVSPDKYKGPDAHRGGGTYPNLLDAHSPFQIDGNFGGCAGVIEMLMQSEYSQQPHITLLPALPEQWGSGKVSGICARGGYTVSMEWENGTVKALAITARRAGKINLTVNGKTLEVKLKRGGNNVRM